MGRRVYDKGNRQERRSVVRWSWTDHLFERMARADAMQIGANMKWVALASLFLAGVVLFGPRFGLSIRQSDSVHRAYSASAPVFWALLLLTGILGGISLLRRH
jgi:hypothetical protein